MFCAFYVNFGSNAASLGNTLTKAQNRNAPDVSVPGEGDLFTVLMVDPDAPSHEHPTMAQWLHWLVTNVPFKPNEHKLDVGQGSLVTSYNGPTPPAGTGFHRYVLLVFKQSQRITVSAPSGRAHFNTSQFMANQGFGTVRAGNFFKTKN